MTLYSNFDAKRSEKMDPQKKKHMTLMKKVSKDAMLDLVWLSFDSNRNNAIEKHELVNSSFGELMRGQFDTLDTDGNGRIIADEWRLFWRHRADGMGDDEAHDEV